MDVRLAPLHPAEPDLHHQLRDALNARISNTNFFVWISVDPLSDDHVLHDAGRIVTAVEAWLQGLDPDVVAASGEVPEREFRDAAADVRVRAVPKKPAARGKHSGDVVGNPEPVLVGWS